MPRKTAWLVVCLMFLLAFLAYLAVQPPTAAAQGGGTPAVAIQPVTPSVYLGDVRNLPQVPARPHMDLKLQEPVSQKSSVAAAIPQTPIALTPMPASIANFAGLNFTQTITGGQAGAGWPPDTNGDVGTNHYILAVNDAFAIYNKTGTLLAAFTENSLWSTSTGSTPCKGNSSGDPVVLYDVLADRWILTNFAFALQGNNPVAPFYECIAVSRTSDPVAGGWNFYPLRTDTGSTGAPPTNTLNDYPKFGLWNDCLYYSANGFLNASTFNGVEFGSFSRSDMYSGVALNGALGFIATTSDPFTMIPSNLRGRLSMQQPPAGTPNYYVSESMAPTFAFEVRKFSPGTNCGSGGSMSAATNVSHASYTVASGNIVPQPNTSTNLDAIDDRLMQKVQYRKVGSTESLWVTHNVRTSSTGNTAMHWAQLNVTGGTIALTPVQEQIFSPDTTLYRWMGSIAADNQGNAALGYSTSNGTSPNFPSIATAGRLLGDPLNQLPRTETFLVSGGGSQTGISRWGDYSAMSVDPVDDCTFWYTNEFYDTQANGSIRNWQTRIVSFKFTTCSFPTAVRIESFEAAPHVSVAEGTTQPGAGLALVGVMAAGLIGFWLWRRRWARG